MSKPTFHCLFTGYDGQPFGLAYCGQQRWRVWYEWNGRWHRFRSVSAENEHEAAETVRLIHAGLLSPKPVKLGASRHDEL